MLSILGFACTVLLVEASTRLEFPDCITYLSNHPEAKGYRSYLTGGVLFSHGENKYTGALISPTHVLVKTPYDKSVNISTAIVTVGMKTLNDAGTTSVLKSTRCGPYTVVTVKKGWRTNWNAWNCLESSSEGEPFPPQGLYYLFGSNPTTSYAEMTLFSLRSQRTCGRNGMVDMDVGYVTGGPFVDDYHTVTYNLTPSINLPNYKLQKPNFIGIVPQGAKNDRINGHFDKWIDGGEGQFAFTFTRFTDDNINCIKKIVLP